MGEGADTNKITFALNTFEGNQTSFEETHVCVGEPNQAALVLASLARVGWYVVISDM
jgi:hypothetical protein